MLFVLVGKSEVILPPTFPTRCRCSLKTVPGLSATSPEERGRWSSGDSDSPPVALRRTWREYWHAARTRRNFRQVANDPTFQEVDWHRIWKGEFGMPTTKVKKRKSK
jgi:hypothetical protein